MCFVSGPYVFRCIPNHMKRDWFDKIDRRHILLSYIERSRTLTEHRPRYAAAHRSRLGARRVQGIYRIPVRSAPALVRSGTLA